MTKTRKSVTRGWKKEQPGFHEKTIMLKNAVKNVFILNDV